MSDTTETIRVHTRPPYTITIGKGLLDELAFAVWR